MTNSGTVWYLPGKGDKPSGPFSADQVLQSWQAGRLAESTLCWREGMGEWLPLAQVEPFASRIRLAAVTAAAEAAGPPRRRRSLPRILALLVLLACLIGAGVVGYCYWTERSTIQQAKQLLADGDYEDASRLLRRLADSRFFGQERKYLLAVVELKQYASEKDDQRSESDPLRRPKRSLKELFEAGDKWRQRAVVDLAEILDEIPPDAPDALVRGLTIIRCLDDLDAGDLRPLAGELLQKAKQWAQGRNLRNLDVPLLNQILTWDPSLSGEVVDLALPDPEADQYALSQGLGQIDRWARALPSLKDPLADGLLKRGEGYWKSGQYTQAGMVFAQVERMKPELREKILGMRLERVKQCLGADDCTAAMQLLRQIGNVPQEMASQVSQLYLEVAKRLHTSDRNTARQALERALKLDPSLVQSEDALLLRIELISQPDDAKLAACQEFLSRFPKSTRRAEVLLMLLSDATELAKNRRGFYRNRARGYLAAGSDAAGKLLKEYPKTPGLDVKVFELAKCIAGDERNKNKQDLGDAVALANELLGVLPDTELKAQIKLSIAGWENRLYEGSTLPPELRELAERVKKELKIMSLTTPGAVGVLETDPRAHHVVQVAGGCTANGFNSQQAEILKRWVYGGGILWCTNDVLKLFDIEYTTRGDSGTSMPAIAGGVHPIVAGCSRGVDLSIGWFGEAVNLSHTGVIPLLSRGGRTTWSLVPYGRGWISDRKRVNETTYDGARFWLNFRLFCLGWEIPPEPNGGKRIPPPPPDGKDIVIKAVDRLLLQAKQSHSRKELAEAWHGATEALRKAEPYKQNLGKQREELLSLVGALFPAYIQGLLKEAGGLLPSRQYDEAQKKVDQAATAQTEYKELGGAMDLSAQIEQVRQEVAKMQNDPATTNLSGVWVTPGGKVKLTEDVKTHQVTVKPIDAKVLLGLPPRQVQLRDGQLKRQGRTRLDGKFNVHGAAIMEVVVSANIVDARTLRVRCRELRPTRKRGEADGFGYVDWRRQGQEAKQSEKPPREPPRGGRPYRPSSGRPGPRG